MDTIDTSRQKQENRPYSRPQIIYKENQQHIVEAREEDIFTTSQENQVGWFSNKSYEEQDIDITQEDIDKAIQLAHGINRFLKSALQQLKQNIDLENESYSTRHKINSVVRDILDINQIVPEGDAILQMSRLIENYRKKILGILQDKGIYINEKPTEFRKSIECLVKKQDLKWLKNQLEERERKK